MKKLLITLLTCALLISGCSTTTEPEQSTKQKHIEAGYELEMIMAKFNGLLLENFTSITEHDNQRTEYTQEMITLVDQLAENSKELKAYAKNESELFVQYTNELAQNAQTLRTNLAEKKGDEEIKPTLQNIERLCYQCHATLHE